jgi:tRNA threonylcarbamoyladenosine biosynthesis protein TsaB
MILALDTSTALAGIALYGAQGLLGELTWRSHRDQTAQLLPMAHKLLELEKTTPDQLTGIAVATGPGSFNGLRVAVSTAKGLALALDIPLFGLSSLDAQAYQHRYLSGNVYTVLEAGRGRLAVGFYKLKAGNWKRQGDFENLTLTELISKIVSPCTVCGELTPEQIQKLEESLGKPALVLSPANAMRRTGFLAEWAWQRLQQDSQGDDLANLQPIYLHQPITL